MADAVNWGGPSAHRSKAMGEVSFEHIFEWLRARIEGEMYATLQQNALKLSISFDT